MSATIDYGIDLGTSNSAIAFQDGAKPRLLAAADESVLLPSAVHVAADGGLILGRDAIARRSRDPANTAIEFKRQMGTTEKIAFPASGRSYSAVELSAAILKELARRAEPTLGGPLRAAIITVPAMFQLAQCEATRQAGLLAGIEHAPLLQEPIAAAMAHAGAGHAREGHWLVYDLGGGTFDVSLVRARAGRLQVLDHDGDNHLGGKDFNRVLMRWAADQVRQQGQLGEFRRSDAALADAFARLATEAERVRVNLSSQDQETFTVEELARGPHGDMVRFSAPVERGLLESLIAPTIQRTIELCKTLLTRNRLKAAELKGIVLVGGPTRTPCLTAMIRKDLGIDARHELDPTTIVAAGAALFAATQKLPSNLRADRGKKTLSMALEYESMTTNPAPLLVGKLEGDADPAGLLLRVTRADGSFDSGPVAISAKRVFSVSLKLRKEELNVFDLALTRNGDAVAVEPTRISILHGMSVSKPPLSQSVGVMLADNSVCWYLRKGAVLPARNTVSHATTVPLQRNSSGEPVKIPLVQGEAERGDRNKVIGVLCIRTEHVARDLPVGAEVQVTLVVDEFSKTTARGYVPLLDQWFEEIVMFQLEGKNADQVANGLDEQKKRLAELSKQAEQLEQAGSGDLDGRIKEVEELVKEGDRDSVDLADQMVRLMTRQIDRVETDAHKVKVKDEFAVWTAEGRRIVKSDEHRMELDALVSEFQAAVDAGDHDTAKKKNQAMNDLVFRAQMQTLEFWAGMLSSLYAKFTELNMVAMGQVQFAEGVKLLDREDRLSDLINICMELLGMLPKEDRAQFGSVASGGAMSSVM